MEDARGEQDDGDGDGQAGSEQASVLHAAIVAAEPLRQRVGFHEAAEIGELASLAEQTVHRAPQGAQDLVAIHRTHHRVGKRREDVGGRSS